MTTKRVLLIGSQPERMTRLRRTFKSLKELGVDVRIMVPSRKPDGRPRIIKGIIRYLVLTLQIAIAKADIYHFYNVPDIIGIPLIWKRGVFIYDVRSPWFSSIKESLGNSLLSKIAGIVERILTMSADIVIGANYPLVDRAKNWHARKTIMIPNYPQAGFGPTRSSEEVRESLDIQKQPTVLYLGKIAKIEGSELLKRIIHETCKSIDDVRFMIVGDGPERQSIERFVKNAGLSQNVLMLGWIPHEEVADYIGAADLCILPRKRDTFSPYTAPENITKAAEYLAVGKPVVAPKIGGFANAGFPIIAVEPDEMGSAVVEYLKNPIPVGDFKKPSWDESHRKLRLVYTRLGAI